MNISSILVAVLLIPASAALADTWSDRAAAAGAQDGRQAVASEQQGYAERAVEYRNQISRLAAGHGGLINDEGCKVNKVYCTDYECSFLSDDVTIPLSAYDGNYSVDYCKVNFGDGLACLVEFDVSRENFGGSAASCYDKNSVEHSYRLSRRGSVVGHEPAKKPSAHKTAHKHK